MRKSDGNSWNNCCHFPNILCLVMLSLQCCCMGGVWRHDHTHSNILLYSCCLETYSVSCRGRIMRFWCRDNATHDGRNPSRHSRSHIHAGVGEGTHTQKWLHTHCLDICLSPLSFSSPTFVALGNICSTDDDKAMLLPLEISHPALFTDRCHGILDFALWIVKIWWSISKLGGGFTYLVCVAHIGLWEILYKQLNHERLLQNFVADLLDM